MPTVSLAGTIRPDVKDEKYIDYGAKHKCVLRIRLLEKSEDKTVTGFGSCVVIKPKVVITAAHAVKGVDKLIVVQDDGTEFPVRWSAFPAKHSLTKNAERYDIAVCYLEKPIDLSFYPEMYRDKDEAGKICSIAGYGVSGTYDNGVTIRKSQKRAGSNFVDEILNGMLICTVGKKNITSLEYMIAGGDSGGGLFIDKKLAGINSNVSTIHSDKNPNSDIYDWSCHTRVSDHVDWIDKCIDVFERIEKEGGIE